MSSGWRAFPPFDTSDFLRSDFTAARYNPYFALGEYAPGAVVYTSRQLGPNFLVRVQGIGRASAVTHAEVDVDAVLERSELDGTIVATGPASNGAGEFFLALQDDEVTEIMAIVERLDGLEGDSWLLIDVRLIPEELRPEAAR